VTTLDDDPGAGLGTDDAAGPALDLSPRTIGAAPTRRTRRTGSPFVWVVLAVIVVAIGFVVFQGLSNATLYFRNVDEAIAHRDDLGTRQFRLQGLVTQGDPGDRDFEVTFNGATVAVRSDDGLPTNAVGDPVVMEGHFADQAQPLFLANRILVKHDETYEADHGDRVTDAEDGRSDGDTGGA
jgi:cytochrome c-type biogenesis protein CcmE